MDIQIHGCSAPLDKMMWCSWSSVSVVPQPQIEPTTEENFNQWLVESVDVKPMPMGGRGGSTVYLLKKSIYK